MNETIKDRIKRFIERTGMSQRDFERQVGVANGYVIQLKNAPSGRVVKQITDAFGDLNRDWLLTGEGKMLYSDMNMGGINQTGSNNVNSEVKVNDSSALAKLVDELTKEVDFLKRELVLKNQIINKLMEQN